MHWQKPTPNTFFLLCLTKAGTGFSSFFLAEIFISPTFSLIWGTETNKNQLKTSVWWGGLSCWSWGMWWCDSRWPRGTAPAGFWAHPSTSRQSRTIPGAWRQLGQSLIDAPGSEEPECHHLLSTGRAALGIFPSSWWFLKTPLFGTLLLIKSLLASSRTARQDEKVLNTSTLELDNKTFLWGSHTSTNLILIVFRK